MHAGPDGAGNITCRWCGETMLRTLADKHMPMCFQRHQQGRRSFGSSAKAGFRPTAGRMPDGVGVGAEYNLHLIITWLL